MNRRKLFKNILMAAGMALISPTLLRLDGLLHSDVINVSVRTCRLSYDSPNLANYPKSK